MESVNQAPEISKTTDYVSRVVAYRSACKDSAEQGQLPENSAAVMEAFGGWYEAVQQNPEYAVIYTSAIRNRGKHQTPAIDAARKLELDVVDALRSCSVIDETEYNSELADIGQKDKLISRANQFVGVFIDVIPEDKLPKYFRKPIETNMLIDDMQLSGTEAAEIERAKEVSRAVAEYIINNTALSGASIDQVKKALKALAGNRVLGDKSVNARYMKLQEFVARKTPFPEERRNPNARNNSTKGRDLIGGERQARPTRGIVENR